MLRRALPLTAVLAIAVLPAACSGGGDDSTGTTRATTAPVSTTAVQQTAATTTPDATSPIPTTASDRVGCRVKLTGAVDTEFTGKDDEAAFSSDYYLSQQEIDDLTSPSDDTDTLPTDTTVPGEEGDLTVPPRPAGSAPVSSWFLLNCQGGDVTINIYANVNSTKDDVPQRPGRYDIAAQGGSDDRKVFSALAAFGAEPTQDLYLVEPGGHLQVDRFDSTGAAGSFNFSMKDQAGKDLRIDGTFDVTCHAGKLCKATG